MQVKKQFETRNTVYMDADLKAAIDEIANKKNWGFSYTCYVLLQQALREKNRKKIKKTEPDQ